MCTQLYVMLKVFWSKLCLSYVWYNPTTSLAPSSLIDVKTRKYQNCFFSCVLLCLFSTIGGNFSNVFSVQEISKGLSKNKNHFSRLKSGGLRFGSDSALISIFVYKYMCLAWVFVGLLNVPRKAREAVGRFINIHLIAIISHDVAKLPANSLFVTCWNLFSLLFLAIIYRITGNIIRKE